MSVDVRVRSGVDVKTSRGISEIENREWAAAIAAGIGGTVNGGFLIFFSRGPVYQGLGPVGLIGIFAVLTLLYPVFLHRYSYVLALSAIFVATHSSILGDIISTLVEVFGLASLSTYAAFVYVGAFWLTVGVFALPLALGTPFPNLSTSFLVGCAAYALSLGGFYGIALQDFL